MTTLDPLGGVSIGAREIYDELKAVGGKVDRLVDQHTDLRGDLADLKADHETRIRTLERSRWPLPSLAAICSIAAVVLALIGLLSKGG